jgi:hypothetical protein
LLLATIQLKERHQKCKQDMFLQVSGSCRPGQTAALCSSLELWCRAPLLYRSVRRSRRQTPAHSGAVPSMTLHGCFLDKHGVCETHYLTRRTTHSTWRAGLRQRKVQGDGQKRSKRCQQQGRAGKCVTGSRHNTVSRGKCHNRRPQ